MKKFVEKAEVSSDQTTSLGLKAPNTINPDPPPLTSHNKFSFWTHFLDCFRQGREIGGECGPLPKPFLYTDKWSCFTDGMGKLDFGCFNYKA